ncbi:MAG: beta-galactosidase [bacterium]
MRRALRRAFRAALVVAAVECSLNMLVHVKSLYVRDRLVGTSYIWTKAPRAGWEADMKVMEALGFDCVRISAYWDRMAPEEGKIVFDEMDEVVRLLTRYDFRMIITTGPVRSLDYPEFFIPSWAGTDNKGFYGSERARRAGLDFVRAVVSRYQSNPNVIAWQFDNEPTLRFWGYRGMPYWYIREGVSAIRALDPDRPVIITHFSGDIHGNPVATSLVSDVAAPHVYVQLFGRSLYPMPWAAMGAANLIALAEWKPVWVPEFQAEDWGADFTPALLKYLFYVSWRQGMDGVLFWEYGGWTYEKHSRDLLPVVRQLTAHWKQGKDRVEALFIALDIAAAVFALALFYRTGRRRRTGARNG